MPAMTSRFSFRLVSTAQAAVAVVTLVGGQGVPRLGGKELMVKVEVVLLAGVQHPAHDGGIHQQAVQALCRVEAVLLAALSRVHGVLHGQLGQGTEHGVGAADAQAGLLLNHVMYPVDILRAVTATAEIAQHRKRNLTVLVAYQLAAKAKIAVYDGGHLQKKFTNHKINTAIGHVFLIFYLYFCSHNVSFTFLLFTTHKDK